MSNFLKLIGNFIVLLLLYAVFHYLFKYLFWASFIFLVIKYTYGKKLKETLPVINELLYSTIYNFDRYCGYEFRSLFTFLFVRSNGTKFGNIEHSISNILGYNQKDKTLTYLGWVLVLILWVIDVKNWFNGGHCIASISK